MGDTTKSTDLVKLAIGTAVLVGTVFLIGWAFTKGQKKAAA